MDKLKKKNLFLEINNNNFIVAVGEYDEELNFKIIDKEIILPRGYQNGKITNLDICGDDLKKTIKKIENRSNLLFSDANVITDQNNFECVNVSGFKKLNGTQILSEDISFIINDIKSKLIETKKNKKIIHLFNSKYFLDYKKMENLPIGLFGDFYSHQLTFFLIDNNDLKNIKSLLNKCNINLKKVILKSFAEGINIVNQKKKDTFIKIIINKNETYLIFFEESAFCFFQKFNFGSDIILKDISKVCSLDISNVRNIISGSNLELLDNNIYVDKKYFEQNKYKKISLKYLVEISTARIEEISNILFNKNNNLYNLKDDPINLYLDFEDKEINYKIKSIFQKNFKKCILNQENLIDEDPMTFIRIFGDLLSRGWAKEAIPILTKKSSWISRIFSSFFE